MPNINEFDLVRGKKGKWYFTEPVVGHFPLLSDDSLLEECHHHLITHPLSIEIDHAAHLLNNQGIRDDLVQYQMWHHCVTTFKSFYNHLGYILNQHHWELSPTTSSMWMLRT